MEKVADKIEGRFAFRSKKSKDTTQSVVVTAPPAETFREKWVYDTLLEIRKEQESQRELNERFRLAFGLYVQHNGVDAKVKALIIDMLDIEKADFKPHGPKER